VKSKKYSAHSKDLLSYKNAADTFYCLYTHFSTALLILQIQVRNGKRGVVSKLAYSGFLNPYGMLKLLRIPVNINTGNMTVLSTILHCVY